MNSSHTYVKELELLILDQLLPVYEKYQKAAGSVNTLYGINPELIKQIKTKKQLPALLRAPEKYS
jgi:hypothetical protein